MPPLPTPPSNTSMLTLRMEGLLLPEIACIVAPAESRPKPETCHTPHPTSSYCQIWLHCGMHRTIYLSLLRRRSFTLSPLERSHIEICAKGKLDGRLGTGKVDCQAVISNCFLIANARSSISCEHSLPSQGLECVCRAATGGRVQDSPAMAKPCSSSPMPR